MSLLKQTVRVLGVGCVVLCCTTLAQGALMNGTFNGYEPWTKTGWAGPNDTISHTADGSGSAYVYMRLATSDPDSVQQIVAVSPNIDYSLSWYSTIDQCYDSFGTISIYGISGGSDVQIASEQFYPGFSSWTLHSIDFNSASYDQVKISFESGTTNPNYQYLRMDDVTLVPEPATLGLLGLGLVGLVRKRS